MQPAFDLKPIKQYKANVAIINKNVIKDTLQNRICAVLQNNSETTVSFPIEIGAADIYSFTTKYFSDAENNITATLQIEDANGVLQLNEKIKFAKTKQGKWNQFTVNTASQINAGKYIVTYSLINAKGLALNGIDVQ
jgi:chromosomal replication initiation ATPase DnaA